MNIFYKIIISIFIVILFCTKSFAQQIGFYLNSNRFNISAYKNIEQVGVAEENFRTLQPVNCPVVIFSSYTSYTKNLYLYVQNYLNNGGKIILITPQVANEEAAFIELSKLVGVNVEKIIRESGKKEINWVEKTLSSNLPDNSRFALVTLKNNTTHLAVFGDIEKHESAVSYNPKGSVISWVCGKDGTADFNNKNIQYVLTELLRGTKNNANIVQTAFKSNTQELNSINEMIDNVYVYQDNTVNYATNISLAKENLEFAKINALYASFFHKNNNEKLYEQYMRQSKKNMFAALSNTNTVFSAENVGIWFDRGTIVNIKSKNEMSKYFDTLKESGINTVYFETINAGYTIYPSKIGYQNPLTKGHDPLNWAISEAHKRNMKLHAWVWVFATGNDRHNSLINKSQNYPGPILEKHNQWALIGETGNLKPKKQPEFWVDPAHKEGSAYLLSLLAEILTKYDVDGIQLDYIRYPFQNNDNLMGFNNTSTEMFTCKTGEKLFCNNYQTNLLWNKWKEDNINNFVRKTAQLIKKTKPESKLSVSVFSKSQDNRLSTIQQNWENWINNSYIDSLIPMSYSSNLSGLNTNLTPLIPYSGKCLIYPAIALKHVNELSLFEQASVIREKGFPGISLFAVAQINDELTNISKVRVFSKNSEDTTKSPRNSALKLLKDYKNMLVTIKTTDYNLTQAQRYNLADLLTGADSAISFANTGQINNAINKIKDLKNANTTFFKTYSTYNPIKKNTACSYLSKAENLLSISIKK